MRTELAKKSPSQLRQKSEGVCMAVSTSTSCERFVVIIAGDRDVFMLAGEEKNEASRSFEFCTIYFLFECEKRSSLQ